MSFESSDDWEGLEDLFEETVEGSGDRGLQDEENIDYSLLLKEFDMHLALDDETRDAPNHVVYSDLVTNSDIVAGEPYHTAFTLENIGSTEFPGGAIRNIRVLGSESAAEFPYVLDLPPIAVSEEEKIDMGLSASRSGHLTYVMDIESADGGRVKVLHQSEDEPTVDLIRFSVRAVDRERLLMLAELREIRRLLEE